jgi:hypothetical protein
MKEQAKPKYVPHQAIQSLHSRAQKFMREYNTVYGKVGLDKLGREEHERALVAITAVEDSLRDLENGLYEASNYFNEATQAHMANLYEPAS